MKAIEARELADRTNRQVDSIMCSIRAAAQQGELSVDMYADKDSWAPFLVSKEGYQVVLAEKQPVEGLHLYHFDW